MAETIVATITAKITAVSENGFKVEGYENWFNLSNDYQGLAIPPVGTEIEFKYKPWLNPKSHKTAYYVDEIIPVTQVAPPGTEPHPSGLPLMPITSSVTAPPISYGGLQQAAAPAPVASIPAPTPTPIAEPPRNGPESVTPDPGSFAYRDTIGIPRTACLKDAGELLASVYAGGASEILSDEQLDHLASNITRLANRLYVRYYVAGIETEQRLADVAMPDDTLVPTPGQMEAPPPEYRG